MSILNKLMDTMRLTENDDDYFDEEDYEEEKPVIKKRSFGKRDEEMDDSRHEEESKPRFLPRSSNNKVVQMRRSMEVSLIKPTSMEDRNVGARGKFLNGKPAHILAHGEGRSPKLLLGGGEAFALRDLPPDIHMAPMRLRRDKPIIAINKTFGLAGSFGPPVYERRTARRCAGST